MASKALRSGRRNRRNTRKQPSVASIVKSVLDSRAETKYGVITLATTVSIASGLVSPITQGIETGDNGNQRTAQQIFLKNIDFRFSAFLPSLGIVGAIRLVLVMDKLNTGFIPNTGDILNTSTITAPMSFLSVLNKRFVVLLDETHPLVAGGSDQEIHVVRKKRVNKVIMYYGSTNVATANGHNAIFLLVLTDLAANTPQYRFDAGLHYTDM